jgi:anti-anti-sigma factor
MNITHARTVIKHLPERMTAPHAHLYFQDLKPFLKAHHANVVFDCSKVRDLDSAGVGVLLKCLEEVMKGNGDIKLAAVPPGISAILELTGVDRLFEVFEKPSEATESFHAFSRTFSKRPQDATLTMARETSQSVRGMSYASDRSSLEAA